MRPMSAEMVESFLKKNGFRLVASKGSHFKCNGRIRQQGNGR